MRSDTVVEGLERFYAHFVRAEFAYLRPHLASKVIYVDLTSNGGNGSAMGRGAVEGVFRRWHVSFADMTQTPPRLAAYNDRADQIPGARYCFEVTYWLRGRYVQTLPGMERRAPATRASARLEMTDIVWLDADGKILHINNRYNVRNLV